VGEGEDEPGVFGDDVGGEEVDFVEGVGDGASVDAAVEDLTWTRMRRGWRESWVAAKSGSPSAGSGQALHCARVRFASVGLTEFLGGWSFGGWLTFALPRLRLPHPSRFSKGGYLGRWYQGILAT